MFMKFNSCELSFSLNGIVYVIYFRLLLILGSFGLEIQTMFTPLLLFFFLEGGAFFVFCFFFFFGGGRAKMRFAPPPLF